MAYGYDDEENLDFVDEAPQVDPSTLSNTDLLKMKYGGGLSGGSDPQYQGLKDQASQQKLFANLADAGDTIGHALAKSNQPVDNKFYQQIANDADRPLKDYISSRAIVQKYLTSKDKLDQQSDIAKQRIQTQGDLAKSRDEAYNRRTGAMEDIGKGRLALAGRGVGIREGNQAAAAATKFNLDPVIKTSNTQLAQIQKGLGRLDDVESGKVPFSTTIKADIEKDIANVISGGTSSSLGQLHRVEFEPYVAGWQSAVDKIKGYQGDINAPTFRKQLRAQLTGLQDDIKKIQASRSGQLHQSFKTAYSQNQLASQTLDENKELYSNTETPASNSFPRTVRKGSQAATVSNEQELKEALAEDWQ